MPVKKFKNNNLKTNNKLIDTTLTNCQGVGRYCIRGESRKSIASKRWIHPEFETQQTSSKEILTHCQKRRM